MIASNRTKRGMHFVKEADMLAMKIDLLLKNSRIIPKIRLKYKHFKSWRLA